MWNVHWCKSATARVAEIAVPMNQTLEAARNQGMQVIFAPSDVFGYYSNTSARRLVESLPTAPVPKAKPVQAPAFPLNTDTDGGCDTKCPEGSPWTHQIDSLSIQPGDAMICSTEGQAEQELINVLSAFKIKNLLYMGVHENM